MEYGWTDHHILTENAEEMARILLLVANARRLEILCLLAEGPLCVKEMEKSLKLSQSAVSQHLAKLRNAHLIQFKKEAQTVYYFIEDVHLIPLLKAIQENYCKPKIIASSL